MFDFSFLLPMWYLHFSEAATGMVAHSCHSKNLNKINKNENKTSKNKEN